MRPERPVVPRRTRKRKAAPECRRAASHSRDAAISTTCDASRPRRDGGPAISGGLSLREQTTSTLIQTRPTASNLSRIDDALTIRARSRNRYRGYGPWTDPLAFIKSSSLTLPLERIGVEGINKDLPTICLLSQHKNFSIVVEDTLAVHCDVAPTG